MQTSLNGFSSFLFIMVSGLTQMIPVHTRKEHTPHEFMFGLRSKTPTQGISHGQSMQLFLYQMQLKCIEENPRSCYVSGYCLIWLIVHH